MILSRGFNWSIPMFFVMIFDWVGGIVNLTPPKGPPVDMGTEIYLLLLLIACFLQMLGIILVALQKYKVGGIIQIVASVIHVPVGVIGIIGGTKAYRFADLKKWVDEEFTDKQPGSPARTRTADPVVNS